VLQKLNSFQLHAKCSTFPKLGDSSLLSQEIGR
jgi:hypothetical protein